MTRLEALMKAGCTVYEAEIIGLKLDALGSDEERVAWIERHLAKFLTAIRAMDALADAKSKVKTLEKLYAEADRAYEQLDDEVFADPYCNEVKVLLSMVNSRAWYCENLHGKRAPNEKWATREAIEARERTIRKSALETEAEAALAQAVVIIGGQNGQR